MKSDQVRVINYNKIFVSVNLSKILIIILLLLAGIYAFCFIENKTSAYIISAIFLVLLITYLIYIGFRNKRTEKHEQRILKNNRKVKAKILAINLDIPKIGILQLQIEHATRDYICSIVLNNPNNYKAEELDYEIGKYIEVFINPKNPNEVIIPEYVDEYPNTAGFNWRSFFGGFFITLASLAGPIIALLLYLFGPSVSEFQDTAYITNKNNKESIWIVRFEEPMKIYISIYDPLSQKKIKSIKDKKEKEIEKSTAFFISSQEKNIVIVGTGKTPVYDVYDAITYSKISGMEELIKKDKIMGEGISEIQKINVISRYNTDDVIKITTNDGNICYYNIQKNMFYHSEETLQKYFFRIDTASMNRQLCSFVLAPVNYNNSKKQLFRIQSSSKEDVNGILKYAGSESFDKDQFENNKEYDCHNCSLTLLSGEQYFYEGFIVYHDSSLVVISSKTNLNKEADEQLTAIDTTGKIIFKISEKDFPNINKMKEDNYHPYQSNKFKSIRCEKSMVFLFEKYGAIRADLQTGSILWKYEY